MENKSKQIIRKVDQFGNIRYWKEGKLHRRYGPALIYSDGTQEWYKNGKRHRKDGPAVIEPDGKLFWFKDGKYVK